MKTKGDQQIGKTGTLHTSMHEVKI